MSERKRPLRYPHDVRTQDIPQEAMDAARYETYRFLFNYWIWQGDLRYLCAICYLQGALDGAQVQVQAQQEDPR